MNRYDNSPKVATGIRENSPGIVHSLDTLEKAVIVLEEAAEQVYMKTELVRVSLPTCPDSQCEPTTDVQTCTVAFRINCLFERVIGVTRKLNHTSDEIQI
jgi:hypothetical protein